MRKRWPLLLASIVVLIGLVFAPPIRLGVFSGLLLWDVLDEKTVFAPDRGKLAKITPTPIVKSIEIPRDGRIIRADIYYTNDGKKRAGILLTHGIIETGKDDPRLVRFARSLARCGFIVVIPELQGMKSFRILLSDVDDIVASFLDMASRTELVDNAKLGLFGFSYGAGPTMIAAAQPAIRERVKFLVSFGGYYDPINVIRFITTGTYEYGDERGFLKPEPYGKWVFFMNNADYVENERDRAALRIIFEKAQKQEAEEIARLLKELTPKARYVYELLINDDPNRVEELVKKTDPRFQEYLAKLSLVSVVPSLQAYLIIGHGSTDPLIPYTESLRLADAMTDKSRVHVAILRLFTHVDPSRKGVSVTEMVTTYVPSLVRFYLLVYDLLRQQS